MMNQVRPEPWNPPAQATSAACAAFATLDRMAQQLLAAMLFDGQRCTQIAQSIGGSATEVRRRAGAAMLALHAAPTVTDGDRGGAVAAMLALRALDALDPDEAEAVDGMLRHQPALQRSYDGYRELVGVLCTMVPRVTPSPSVLTRLRSAV